MEHQKVRDGLHKLYLCQILSIVTTGLVATYFLTLIGVLAGLFGVVLSIVGLASASREVDGYKPALYISIAQLLINALSNVKGAAGSIFDILSNAMVPIAVWIVIKVTVRLLEEGKQDEIAQKGRDSMKLYLSVFFVSFAASVLSEVFTQGVLYWGISIVGAVSGIAAIIIYMLFLKAAKEVV